MYILDCSKYKIVPYTFKNYIPNYLTIFYIEKIKAFHFKIQNKCKAYCCPSFNCITVSNAFL